MEFKIGDKIRAIGNEKYGVTCKNNEWEGEIISIQSEKFTAKTIHELGSRTTKEWDGLEPQYFELIDNPNKSRTKEFQNNKMKMEGYLYGK
jgi:hypothetical protein